MKKCSRNPNILIEKLEIEKERNKELKQKLQEQGKTHENEKVKLENKYLKDTVEVLKNNKGNTQNINYSK